jgi:hypothetical protein
MIAMVYFGEMLVASLLAIVMLAISQLRVSSDAVLFAGGVVALTLAEYLPRRMVSRRWLRAPHLWLSSWRTSKPGSLCNFR